MAKRILRCSAGLGIAALLLLLFIIVASQPRPPGNLGLSDLEQVAPLLSRQNVAFAAASGLVIDHGDPLIDDDHIDFMDRGRYAYQDMVGGTRCGSGLVNVVHGNLVYTRRELFIPGRGLPLELSFTYNSGSFFNGRYGYGWQMNYNLRYVTNNANDNVIIVREDDRTDIFVKQPDGSFRPTYGVRDTLEELATGGYRLTDREGVQYWFDSSQHHYVTRIQDPNDNALTFTYDDRQLTKVTDATGRQLTFTYTNDKLTAVSDPLGRTFRYKYDGDNLVKVTNPEGQAAYYTYGADCHDLESITDARGNSQNFSYNADYQVEELTACCGTVRFAYDLENKTTTVTDENGDPTTYSYDQQKRVTAIQDARRKTTSRTWDEEYNLTSVTNARGFTTNYEYDSLSRLVRVSEPENRTTQYGYAATLNAGAATLNKVTSITDANQHTTQYEYDANGNLIKTTDPLDHETIYSYDSHGQMTSRQDARGYTTKFRYDSYGNLKKRIDPLDGETTYTYDLAGNLRSETDAEGRITEYSYDSLNRLVVVTDALGYTISYSYDPVGNRISETDGKGRITEYSYDSLNRLVVITDALGYTINYSYDPVGNRISETDANGHTISYSYDPVGNRISETDANGHTISYSYDPVGNRISETDANGHTTNYEYDGLNRLIRTHDPLGALVHTDAPTYVTNYSYDPVGNRISETDANGNTISYEYDPLNRLLVITDALGSTISYSYDPVGNRISETDANGYTISYEYDPLNRLAVITDALGHTTTHTYDGVGSLVSKVDANHHEWQYEYDALDRCTKGISPMNHETTYTYDEVGNRVSREDPNGNVTDYSYDDLNRLVEITYPDGTGAEYQYDRVGNLLTLTHTGGLGEVFERDYDKANRMVTETIDYGPFTKTVVYSYDKVDNITKLTDPDGQQIRYRYDEANHPIQVTDPKGGKTNISYDPAGRRTETRFPNGTRTAYGYDDADRLTSITTRNAADTILFQYLYVYDAAGRLLRIDDKDGNQVAEFGYNQVGWLKQAEYATGDNRTYTYDPVGNRLSQGDLAGTTTYTYNDEDRVLTQDFPGLGLIGYSYDDNANMIQTDSTTYHPVVFQYDFENRLVGFLNPGNPLEYSFIFYSPEGVRLAREEQGQRTYYYPTLMGDVVEMSATGQTTTRLNPGISMGPGTTLNTDGIDTASTAYIHWDGRDNTTHFTDEAAAELEAFQFDYFGQMLDPLPNDPAVPDLEPGLYATGHKVDWDPMLYVELLQGDYAPDIDQHYGGVLFEPGEHLGMEYDWNYVSWYTESPWAFTDTDITVEEKGKPAPPKPEKQTEKCTHGCFGWAWGKKYVEWKGEWKYKWTCREMDYLEACENGKPAAKEYADKDCEYWDGPACECKGKYGSAREFDWVKQRRGEGWMCYCKIVYRGDCKER